MTIFHKSVFCLLLIISGISCSSQDEKHSVNTLSVSLYNKGMEYYMNNNDSAIMFFNKAIESDSLYYFAYFYKQVSECRAKKYDEAMQTLKKMLVLWPENSSCHSDLGLLFEKKGDTIQSLLHFNKAVDLEILTLDTMSETNKNYPYFLLTVAMDNVYSHKDKEAKIFFKKAHEVCRRIGDVTTAQCIENSMDQSRKEFLVKGFECD